MTFLLWGKPAKKNQGTKRYRIVITEEHCAGHRLDERNCPGIRSFKDAVPWYKRILTPTWIFEQSSNNKWRATNEHGFCVDMIHAMPGDIVYFERIKD